MNVNVDGFTYEQLNYDKIGEKVFVMTHKSGLKAFICPKPGYSRKYGAFAVNFGSLDAKFRTPGEHLTVDVPDGTAHFLEHKLFEQETGNIMEDFSGLGASPNAYTGFANTVYLFSCTSNLKECLKLLLDFVQKPYFTDEGIEKEKRIINQEILMKLDDPDWVVFFNLMKSLFPGHPVSKDIGGTQESIALIDKDLLRKCYDAFYHPSNMILLIVGDCSPDDIFPFVNGEMDRHAADSSPFNIDRIDTLPSGISGDRITDKLMEVSSPLFQLGFRDRMVETGLTGKERLLREVTIKILLDLLIGKSSRLYNDLYAEGIINGPVDFDFNSERSFAFSVIAGESQDPIKLMDRVKGEIMIILRSGIDPTAFGRLCDAWYGRLVRTLNSVEKTAYAFISVYFKGVTLFDYYDLYDKITLQYAGELFRDHFDIDRMALSTVRPVGPRGV